MKAALVLASIFGLSVFSFGEHQVLALESSEVTGFVPCGFEGAPDCQACYVVIMVNNIVEWLVGILSVVAVIMIVVAGAKLVTSGGNPGAMESAKKTISNVLIGFVILLAGWLILDTVMKVLVSEDGVLSLRDQGGAVTQSWGPWNEIKCVEQPKPKWVSQGLVGGATLTEQCEEKPDGTFDCSDLEAQCTAGGGEPTVDNSLEPPTVKCFYQQTAYAGSCEIIDSGPCAVENLEEYFGSRSEEASRICNKESGGAPVESGSDRCCGPDGNCSGAPSFSGGYFQVNILAHADQIPGCTPGAFYQKNGSSAQGNCVKRNSRGICIGWSCQITDTAMYNKCMEGARDHNLNLTIAKNLFDSRGFQPWLNSANICEIPK